MTSKVVIDTSAENAGPTIEQSHEALVKEGIIEGTPSTETEPKPEDGNVEDAGQGNDTGEGADADERPSWLPEKFKAPEDMAKAYAELEKKQSKKADPKEAEGEPTENTEGTEGEAREAVENAGLDFDALSSEYETNGELSEDSIAALTAAGIPKGMLDSYIAGVEAQVALYENSVKNIVGGDDAYTQLTDWGRANLSEGEIDAFDNAVNSGDIGTATIAIKGLKAQMELASGTVPQRTVDGKTANSAGEAYESYAQMEADMNDPRYQSDEAFRQKVYNKLARSNL